MYVTCLALLTVMDVALVSTVAAGTMCIHLGPASPRHLMGPYPVCFGEGGIPKGRCTPSKVSLFTEGELSCPDLCSKYLLPQSLSTSPVHFDSSVQHPEHCSKDMHKMIGYVTVQERTLVPERAS